MIVIESTANGREHADSLAEGVALYNQRLAEAGATDTVSLSVHTEQGDDVMAFHTPTMDWAVNGLWDRLKQMGVNV